MDLCVRIILSALAAALFLYLPATADIRPKEILVLYSHDARMPWQIDVTRALDSVFKTQAPGPFVIHSEYTILSQFFDDIYVQKLVDLIRVKYTNRKIDLIFSLDFAASDFLLKHGNDLFPEIPIIFTSGTNTPLGKGKPWPRMTGVLESIDPGGTLDTALRLHPGTRRVVVIIGEAETDNVWGTQTRDAFRAYSDPIEFIYLSNLSMEEILREVAGLPPHTLVFYVLTLKDGTGDTFISRDIVLSISRASTAPVYGLWESFIGHGIVGGHVSSSRLLGTKIAKMGLRVLAGESPGDIPVVKGANIYMFDWRELQRWGIDERDLPPGSIVRHKTLSFWETNKGLILIGLGVCLAEALLIIFLFLNLTKRRRAEGDLKTAQANLEDKVQTRTTELTTANEYLRREIDERRRTEEKLAKSRRFLASVFDSIQDGISVLDTDLNIVHTNHAMKKWYAHALPLEGKKCYDAYHGRDKACTVCPTIRSLKTGQLEMDEVKSIREDKETAIFELFAFPILDDAEKPTGVVEYVRDITQRKRAEDFLRERELLYRSLFENNLSVMLFIDPDTGTIVDANPAACSFYGYAKKEITDMKIMDFNTLTEEEVFEEMSKAKTEKRNYFNFCHRLSNGSVRDVEVYSGPIRVSGKALLCSIIHDISERKTAEKERERLIHELQKALSEVKTLRGFLPICASCKKIRDDKGYWKQIESYIQDHSEAEFSHSICPACAKELYPDIDLYD